MSNSDDDGMEGRLPHWFVPGAVHFVTWRCHRESRAVNGPERQLVLDTVRRFDGVRYHLSAVVVMNDHAHALVVPIAPENLKDTVEDWKSISAKDINRLRRCDGVEVWQAESFDRVMRNARETEVKLKYIANNPWKRWPFLREYPWLWSSG